MPTMARNNQQTETQTEETAPAYLAYAAKDHPLHHIFLAQQARVKKAEARAELSDLDQEKLWAKEKFTEIRDAIKGGKRRTLMGFVQNAKLVSASDKSKLCDAIIALAEELRANIPSDTGQSEVEPLADPFA